MSKDWDEPRPPAPSELDLSVGEWLKEIEDHYGWDDKGLVLIATEMSNSWENGFPQRHLAVELIYMSAPVSSGIPHYETMITSTHHFDEKESHGR